MDGWVVSVEQWKNLGGNADVPPSSRIAAILFCDIFLARVDDDKVKWPTCFLWSFVSSPQTLSVCAPGTHWALQNPQLAVLARGKLFLVVLGPTWNESSTLQVSWRKITHLTQKLLRCDLHRVVQTWPQGSSSTMLAYLDRSGCSIFYPKGIISALKVCYTSITHRGARPSCIFGCRPGEYDFENQQEQPSDCTATVCPYVRTIYLTSMAPLIFRLIYSFFC